MGLFNKKKEERKVFSSSLSALPQLPTLPELPKLPELPNYEENSFNSNQINQLPSMPNNSLGYRFSQNMIKEAVTGKEEGDEGLDFNRFEEEEMPAARPSIQKPEKNFQFERSAPLEISEEKIVYKPRKSDKDGEPIFVRIDKFEESLNRFEKTKEKVSEIDKMLLEIKKLKEDEEKELVSWEKEMQVVRDQIDKIDKELFSKL